jgi:hypothetical protein
LVKNTLSSISLPETRMSTASSAPLRSGRLRRARLIAAALALVLGAGHAAARDFVYVVRPGDNPWNLTERYLKSIDYWPRIQDYNRILAPKSIQPGTVLRIPVAWMRAEAVAARVIDLTGEVHYGTPERLEPLSVGSSVPAGVFIRSGEDASLTLEFPDGSRSLVGANTALRLRQTQRLNVSGAQQTEIELERGHIENTVRPTRASTGGRYIIRTPAAIAAVRGTDFRVTAAGDGMRTETLTGKVAIDNRRGTVLLPAGTGNYAGAGLKPEKSAPLLPAPTLEALPERIDRVPFRLPVEPVAGALRYRTQIARSADFTSLLSDRTVTATEAVGSGALADGRYRMRVRAVDARGLEGLDAEHEILIDAQPEPPYPSLPEQGGFATDAQIRFEWAGNPDASRYHFQLAGDPHFEQILLQRDVLDAPGLSLDETLALPPGEYFWRVAVSTDAEGRGPYSDPQRFRRPAPGPSAEPPEIDSETLRLNWREQPGVERYEVQIASTADFAAAEYVIETADTGLSMARPPSGTWHVRIRSREPGAPYGPWSKAQQIELPHNHWRALWVLLPLLFVP